MIFIPIKWFPWLCVIVGVMVVAGGEVGTGLILTAIGAVWLSLRSQSKKKDGQSSTRSHQVSPPVKPTDANTIQTNQRVAHCPTCGARVDSGAVYCDSCGHKL